MHIFGENNKLIDNSSALYQTYTPTAIRKHEPKSGPSYSHALLIHNISILTEILPNSQFTARILASNGRILMKAQRLIMVSYVTWLQNIVLDRRILPITLTLW